MPLDEGIEDVVTLLTSFYRDGGDEIRELYGDQAPMMAEEMGNMIGEIFQGETPYGQLWLEYKDDPEEHEAEVIGALEVLEESVPMVTIRMEGYYAAFLKMMKENTDVGEDPEPEDTVNIEEIESIKSNDDFDDDDEYREENTYLVGNVEDHSTSAMYYEGLDTSIEPNESEDD